MSKPVVDGVHANQRLSLEAAGKAIHEKPGLQTGLGKFDRPAL